MFLSALLSVVGLGFLCWLLFSLAVYALPFFVTVRVGYYAFENGAGPIGAIAVALFVGVVALILAVKGLSETGGAGETWTLIFASIGAIIVGATAWVRIASPAGPDAHHQLV